MRRRRVGSVIAIAIAACGSDQRGDEGLFGDGSQGSVETSAASADASEDGGGASSSTPADDDGSSGAAAETNAPIFDVAMGDSGGADDGGTMGAGCSFMDVLFVVDISASMHEEQANLAANFPAFVQVLDDYVANDDNAQGYRI